MNIRVNNKDLKSVAKTLVRQQLEYASTVWCGIRTKNNRSPHTPHGGGTELDPRIPQNEHSGQ